jgi:hypothetical protein
MELVSSSDEESELLSSEERLELELDGESEIFLYHGYNKKRELQDKKTNTCSDFSDLPKFRKLLKHY